MYGTWTLFNVYFIFVAWLVAYVIFKFSPGHGHPSCEWYFCTACLFNDNYMWQAPKLITCFNTSNTCGVHLWALVACPELNLMSHTIKINNYEIIIIKKRNLSFFMKKSTSIFNYSDKTCLLAYSSFEISTRIKNLY